MFWGRGLRVLAAAVLTWGAAVSSAEARNLMESIKDAGSFKQMLRGYEVSGLSDLLTGEGPYTIFAPSDEAFLKLPKAAVADLMQPHNRDKLSKLLRHHMLGGLVLSRDYAGKRLEAIPLAGDALLLDARTQPKIAGAKIVRSDIVADNGVIHVIDTVLIPNFDDLKE
ncbi:MAG: fasciclin domain-containing protein [Rhodospirillaceae bacterium]|nr:fasciclin domain-containing protein [Rhodospirillaceae bacterium]